MTRISLLIITILLVIFIFNWWRSRAQAITIADRANIWNAINQVAESDAELAQLTDDYDSVPLRRHRNAVMWGVDTKPLYPESIRSLFK